MNSLIVLNKNDNVGVSQFIIPEKTKINGIPPALLIPSLILLLKSKKCRLHGDKSLPDWAIPIIGFPD